MLKKFPTLPAKNKVGTNKFVLGFAALAATTVIGTTGVVAAQANNNKPSKQECASAGFKNYGQCVREWAKAKNKPGGGYGGHGGNIITNIGLEIRNSNNNVINIIVNVFR